MWREFRGFTKKIWPELGFTKHVQLRLREGMPTQQYRINKDTNMGQMDLTGGLRRRPAWLVWALSWKVLKTRIVSPVCPQNLLTWMCSQQTSAQHPLVFWFCRSRYLKNALSTFPFIGVAEKRSYSICLNAVNDESLILSHGSSFCCQLLPAINEIRNSFLILSQDLLPFSQFLPFLRTWEPYTESTQLVASPLF